MKNIIEEDRLWEQWYDKEAFEQQLPKTNKVFLYLYPIKEYTRMFLFSDDVCYDEWNIKRPFPILNECIQKRYRDNGYQVVFALYPDKEIYGITPKKEDKIIYTDILFSENSAYDENGKVKNDFIPKYPNEQLLIEQLGQIDELVIGGYHSSDCVQRVGEIALNNGINTIVDLDLTDFFFSLYRKEEYFNIEEYSPKKYKEYIFNKAYEEGELFFENHFNQMYSSLIYGFNDDNQKIDNKKI